MSAASKKGPGSFWISKQAIKALLTNKATATEIATYLVLAKSTDDSGILSTAGYHAMRTSIGIGEDKAKDAVAKLCRIQVGGTSKKPEYLVYPSDKWPKEKGAIPEAPTKQATVRWVINDLSEGAGDLVWFSNNLIDGFGKFKQPLKKLKRYGDAALRALLLCYEHHDLELYGGINPQAVYHKYIMDPDNQEDSDTAERDRQLMPEATISGLALWHGMDGGIWAFHRFSLPILGLDQLPTDKAAKNKAMEPFWKAMHALDYEGFIYRVVTVFDRNPEDQEAQPIYELGVKSKHGYAPKGEEGLGSRIATLSSYAGHPVADAMGRMYGKYAAITPEGIDAHIVGIYRLRFRVSNPSNHGVKSAWVRIGDGQKEAKEWIKTAEIKVGMRKPGVTDEGEDGGPDDDDESGHKGQKTDNSFRCETLH